MTSDKAGAALLAHLFIKKGLEHIIISPGSRNAPLVLSFAQNPAIKAISIVDERSAAYFAVGLAQQTKKAVAITCTSGGAVLNYAPAIAEAYYQKIPLLVITADRPEELVDQGDGQTIRQKNVYANYIKGSFEIPGEISDNKTLRETGRIICEAIDMTVQPDCGPVHINIPFAEPIYNQVEQFTGEVEITSSIFKPAVMPVDQLEALAKQWNASSKKLLVAGMMDPNPEFKKVLKSITDDPSVVLLTETTSNLMNGCSCPCIDKVVHTIGQEEADLFQPDLLVTFGGHVVSKMVKAFLRKYRPAVHWHIDQANPGMNTYQCLTHPIQADPVTFLEQLGKKTRALDSHYHSVWDGRDQRSEARHKSFLSTAAYSDLKVFEVLLDAIPQQSNIQLGNSTAVRYAQLFKQTKEQAYFSNRGTSGIDGTVSTAAGAAYASSKLTVLITGDLGFLYDSNALMNHYLTGNLRIIIINNNGGGIFRFIPGPGQTDQLEEFFEAHHHWTARYIARNFDVPYYEACNLSELKDALPRFFSVQPGQRPAILEIQTPGKKNAAILKDYFKYLAE